MSEERRNQYGVIVNNYIGVINIFVLMLLIGAIFYANNKFNAAVEELRPTIKNFNEISDNILSVDNIQDKINSFIKNVETNVTPDTIAKLFPAEMEDFIPLVDA